MKHSEMMALAAVIFLARALPKGVALSLTLVTSLISIYLSAHGN
jgi:hypothetical protein